MIKKLTNKFKKNNKGFTLVELLVVIAIIGVLGAIAAPNLFGANEKAKVAALGADYRAIKTAALSYITEKNAVPSDIEALENEGYLDKAPAKTPFGGEYKLALTGTKLDIILEDVTIDTEVEGKIETNLGLKAEECVPDNSSTPKKVTILLIKKAK